MKVREKENVFVILNITFCDSKRVKRCNSKEGEGPGVKGTFNGDEKSRPTHPSHSSNHKKTEARLIAEHHTCTYETTDGKPCKSLYMAMPCLLTFQVCECNSSTSFQQ